MTEDRDARLARAVQLREQDHTEQARQILLELSQQYSHDVEVAYQAAWAHDKLGLEAQAVPFYERALAVEGLSAADRLGAYIGLGSTYRVLGRYAHAETTLRQGLHEFPGNVTLTAFLAMVLYNLGQAREAVSSLLVTLLAASADEQLRRYRRAIEIYAADLDATV
ncbi:MAG TPA: tetratricopeptide repeat protein [Candidatus Limnocylindrales bacterium]|nr:tetratricopeptide repeat protein [Candidatus Limnocylindrales bacterium]